MKHLTVRAKLSLAFGALALVVLAVAGLSMYLLGRANDRFVDYVEGLNARATMAARLRAAIDQRAIAARNLVLVTAPQDLALERQIVERAQAQAQDSLQRLQALALAPTVPPEVRRMIDEIARVEQMYAPVALDIVQLALRGQHAAAIAKMNAECRPLLAALSKATDAYAELTAGRIGAQIRAAEEEYAVQRQALVATSVLALLLAVVAGTLITRNLVRQLGSEPHELRRIMNQVAGGELTAGGPAPGADPGSVLAAVGRMQAALTGIVHTVRASAHSVASASEQIARSNRELAARTQGQAAVLERTAASMEAFSVTERQNVDKARKANELAQSASAVAERGGVTVGRVVTTMRDINASSRRIEDIIGVIDGIAFQTNILALNAAVEAARAGEQGRGFAVVASEVRSLAARSAEAAHEIKALIVDSVQRVEQGASLVDEAGQTMTDIVAGIRRVADTLNEISTASEEQSRGVLQVGQAVHDMDRTTQDNTAMVQEMTGAAADMRAKARQLVEAMAYFKLPAA